MRPFKEEEQELKKTIKIEGEHNVIELDHEDALKHCEIIKAQMKQNKVKHIKLAEDLKLVKHEETQRIILKEIERITAQNERLYKKLKFLKQELGI